MILLDTCAIDGLANLLGTGGSNRPVALEKAQASRFKLEAAVVEHLAYHGLGIRNRVLVEDAMHPAWQDFIEMRHQIHIVVVEAPHVVQVVAEILTFSAELLEI